MRRLLRKRRNISLYLLKRWMTIVAIDFLLVQKVLGGFFDWVFFMFPSIVWKRNRRIHHAHFLAVQTQAIIFVLAVVPLIVLQNAREPTGNRGIKLYAQYEPEEASRQTRMIE
jgi:hypothetical protein